MSLNTILYNGVDDENTPGADSFANLNVKKLRCEEIVGNTNIRKGITDKILHGENPDIINVEFDSPHAHDKDPTVVCTLEDLSIPSLSSIYVQNKSNSGFQAVVNIQNSSDVNLDTTIVDTETLNTISALDLEYVDSNPSFVYAVKQGTNSELKFMRASDSVGDTFPSAPENIVLETNTAILDANLLVVNSNPAVLYQTSGGNLYYYRSDDSQGTSWTGGKQLTVQNTGDLGFGSELILEGSDHPAFAYYDIEQSFVGYKRGNDVNGATFANHTNIATNVQTSSFNLALVNGNPTCVLNDDTNDNKRILYNRGADLTGSTFTQTLLQSNSDNTDYLTSNLIVVDGTPEYCYTNNNNLYFQKASDISGSTWADSLEIATLSTFEGIEKISLGLNGSDRFIALADGVNQNCEYVQKPIGQNWDQESTTIELKKKSDEGLSYLSIDGKPSFGYILESSDDKVVLEKIINEVSYRLNYISINDNN